MTRMIIDTDIGYDPDDLFALLFALNSPEANIALITTADEIGTKRAAFTQMILTMCRREDIPVVCGADLGNHSNIVVEELLEEIPPEFDTDYIGAMKKVADSTIEPILYLGIGGFTNLANFYKAHPDYKDRFDVFVMGGAVNYSRKEGWIEHNVKIDGPSAKFVIENPPQKLFLVMAQTTFQEDYEVGDRHPFFAKLKNSSHPAHKMLVRHLELFHKKKNPFWPRMHDPLTFSSAIGKDFVAFHQSAITVNENWTLVLASSGPKVYWSDPVSKKNEFMEFLGERLFK